MTSPTLDKSLSASQKAVVIARQLRDRLTRFIGDGIEGVRQSPPNDQEVRTVCDQMEATAKLIRAEVGE